MFHIVTETLKRLLNKKAFLPDDKSEMTVPMLGTYSVEYIKQRLQKALSEANQALVENNYAKLNEIFGRYGSGVIPAMISALAQIDKKE